MSAWTATAIIVAVFLVSEVAVRVLHHRGAKQRVKQAKPIVDHWMKNVERDGK